MINAQLKVIIMVLDENLKNYKIVSSDKDKFTIPSLNIEKDFDINDCLNHILSITINKNDSYHNFKLTDVTITDVLDIYYLVFVTYETIIKNGSTHNKQLVLNQIPNNAKKIISLL